MVVCVRECCMSSKQYKFKFFDNLFLVLCKAKTLFLTVISFYYVTFSYQIRKNLTFRHESFLVPLSQSVWD